MEKNMKMYKSDIEIAQAANMKPIIEIANSIGIDEDYIEQYGKYKAKINNDIYKQIENNKNDWD